MAILIPEIIKFNTNIYLKDNKYYYIKGAIHQEDIKPENTNENDNGVTI